MCKGQGIHCAKAHGVSAPCGFCSGLGNVLNLASPCAQEHDRREYVPPSAASSSGSGSGGSGSTAAGASADENEDQYDEVISGFSRCNSLPYFMLVLFLAVVCISAAASGRFHPHRGRAPFLCLQVQDASRHLQSLPRLTCCMLEGLLTQSPLIGSCLPQVCVTADCSFCYNFHGHLER